MSDRAALPEMSRRTVWHPPWYAWAVLGIALLALVYRTVPHLLHGPWLLVTPLLVTLLLLILARVWHLPPATMICAAVVLSIFSGDWGLLGVPGIPLDRIAIVGVVLALVLRAPGTARIPRVRVRGVHLWLALMIVYTIGSAAAAGTLGVKASLLGLIDQVGVTPYLIFMLAPAMLSGARERNMLIATLVVLGAYLGLTAIFESLGPHGLVFPRYIVASDAASPGGRAGGPFQSSVTEGFATFACAVAATIAFAQWRGWTRRLAAAVAVVSLFGCFLTLERGVWLGAVAAIVAAAATTRIGRRWLLPGGLLCVIVVGGALLLSPALSSKVSSRATYQVSVWDRQNQTATALRMIESKPLFGFGWGRFTTDGLEYFRQPRGYPLTGYSTPEKLVPLHDTYLSYAVELGLTGALLWLVAISWGIGGAIFARAPSDLRLWKLGLIALTVFFLVVALFNPLAQPFTELLLWLWAGAALSGVPARARSAREATPIQAGPAVAYAIP